MQILVVCCSSILFIVACLLHRGLSAVNKSIAQLQALDPANQFSDCLLQSVTSCCSHCEWLPTLLKVYFLGVIETVYITFYKRGLFGSSLNRAKNERFIDEMIDNSSLPNLPVAVLVGADSGIGIEICRGLLKAGFRVIVGSRFLETDQNTLSLLKKSTGSDKLHILHVDLTSFRSVRSFAEEVKLQLANERIRLLINNAGVMNAPYSRTVDGYESQCQINYLAPFLLSQLLLPLMDTAEGRILFASSSTLYAANHLDTDMPRKKYRLNGLDHYAYSKACIAQLAKHLSRRTGHIKVFAYHPGTVRTKLFQHTTIFTLPIFSKIFDFIMLSPKEGAETPLYLCLTKNIKGSGIYWANKHSYSIPSLEINHVQDGIDLLWMDTMRKCGITVDEQ